MHKRAVRRTLEDIEIEYKKAGEDVEESFLKAPWKVANYGDPFSGLKTAQDRSHNISTDIMDDKSKTTILVCLSNEYDYLSLSWVLGLGSISRLFDSLLGWLPVIGQIQYF